ncbi:MAG TPA: PEGA domain-containing protein [Polyangiaceae bacterium]|nr:PEGA domain-containing protein [Polyangiaceae bacterium]
MRAIAAGAVLCAASCPARSFAQQPRRPPLPTPASPKTLADALTGDAKASYEAGKLLFGDGDWEGAEIKFKAAYDASGDARLLWNMAACEKSQRHYARTEELVRRYLDKGGDTLTEQDRADAKALLEAIDSFTVKLAVRVNEPGAEVFIDDTSVGTSPLPKPVVVDIGTRKIVVRKEGFKESEQQVPVGGSATASLDVKLTPQIHEGSVHIVTLPTAEISIDGNRVGVGRYDGKLKSGGHTLRVTAAGMTPYQTEVVVNDDESRAIDVPLERAPEPPKPKEWSPGGEVAVSMGPGVKMQNGTAAFFDLRAEIGWKPGWPTELGFIVDVGSIDPSANNCATSYHGPNPTGPGDVDVRYGFSSCLFVKPGLELVVHILPRSRFDVTLGAEAGFRFQFVQYASYDPLHAQSAPGSAFLPGIDAGGRLGIDYHPVARLSHWSVGVFGSFIMTIIGQEAPDNNGGPGIPPSNDQSKGMSYPWLLFGARTSLIF